MKPFRMILHCLCLLVTSLCLGQSQFLPFDSYGEVSWELEKVHLDNFAVFLQHEQDSIGYIIVYAGRRACVGEVRARALRAKKYVVDTRGIQANRVTWIDGGYRENFTIVLQPASRGLPPSILPTLKRSEVKIIKNCKANHKTRGS